MRETAFEDVFDSQRTIRTLLDVLSRPGTVGSLPHAPYQFCPPGFCPPVLSIMKTLCDHRVSFSVGSAENRQQWVRYLEVNLATPFKAVAEAEYAVFDGTVFDADFSLLSRGTLEFPETSTTALISVGGLAGGAEKSADAATTLRLSGPGVRSFAFLGVTGLDARYLEERTRANRSYPLGIDLFLVDTSGLVAGIPRTSTVEVS